MSVSSEPVTRVTEQVHVGKTHSNFGRKPSQVKNLQLFNRFSKKKLKKSIIKSKLELIG